MFGLIESVFAGFTGIVLLAFAGIALGGSTIALAVCTPIFVIFSPILIPATIAASLLATGFALGGSSGGRALKIIMWIIKKYTGKEPPKIPGLTPPPALTSQPGPASQPNNTHAE